MEEIPTFEELAEITRLVAELTATVVPDEDDSSSGEDVSSVECDSDEESSDEDSECCADTDSCASESSERRPYKKGKRAKGYALYIKNGGTRASWSEKSDKYKDKYYDRKNGK